MNSARDIAQDVLDRQGAATLAGDIDETLAWCDMPCTLDSLEGRVVATTEAQMRAICATFIERLKDRNMTHMVRRCLEAEFKGPDAIWATYETRYVRAGNLLSGDPYVGFVILVRGADRWKISMLQVAVDGNSPAGEALRKRFPDSGAP
ncbi:hypothetical protein [Maliponia aquimaris]|uniref:SnoaL-like domain-containing protein n=1 Tax=Maliponia aquimaris TaxID=1673631 RepID=A0A238KL97_9RHOB|nr:hypothetical protein [Maliponia aquimaris]SMX43523.1 hypothetical protein MAA8898_02847 [Maliponia aquimaris]